jgi:hypothetical protein
LERPVEVAVFDRGELQSVRLLSLERERWASFLAGTVGIGLVLVAMAASAALIASLGLVVHAATFFVSWLGVAAVVGYLCARWTRRTVGRYRLGADINADAFAMAEVDLVRRAGSDYELGLVPGMSGAVEGGRSSLPLEALTGRGSAWVPLPQEGRVRIEFGNSTFVIARRPDASAEAAPMGERLGWLGTGALRQFLRTAALGVPVAALATLFAAVPAAYAVTEPCSRWAIPRTATPLEAELLIRAKAQLQTPTLHQCFDPLPLYCQRAGYVGVGLSLSKEGEVLSHWVSRSTFPSECPVSECMANVVSGWVFEPMRERMKLVLPVQVRRTKKPMPSGHNVIVVSPDALDAGAWRGQAADQTGQGRPGGEPRSVTISFPE